MNSFLMLVIPGFVLGTSFEAQPMPDAVWAPAAPIGQARSTTFNPGVHGFHFSNSFTNDVVFDIKTGGLCGGMVYAALDHFNAGRATPRTLDYRPATGSATERYIFGRQLKTFENQADKWIELNSNPGGARNNEFYRWGIQGFNGGRLEELRALIDAGRPAPLGLWHADGHKDRPGDHQVLAIGYEMGRYDGRFGANAGDLKIFIYDPNYPRATMVLQPDPATGTFFYSNLSNKEAGRWLTYFVDRKYAATPAPTVPVTDLGPNDGKIRELVVEIKTGGDDLRGGNDNVSLSVGLFGRSPLRFENVNASVRWIGNYSQFVAVKLPTPVLPENITSVGVHTKFGGGISGDNWNMDFIIVRARGGGVDRILVNQRGAPLKRFTGNVHDHVEQIRWLLMEARMGARGLSGGALNASLIVIYRGRPPQNFANLNAGLPWAPNTTARAAMLLNQTIPVISTSLLGSYGRDSRLPPWDLNSFKLTVREGGRDNVIYNRSGTPLHGFSPSSTAFLVRI